MLVDDSEADNFIHETVIRRNSDVGELLISKSVTHAFQTLRERLRQKLPLPELLFLDLNMPGKSGWDFLRLYQNWAKKHKESICIWVLSTSDNPMDEKRALKLPTVQGYIQKPLKPNLLKTALAG